MEQRRQARRQARPFFIKKETTYSSLIPIEEYLVFRETQKASFAEGKQKLVGLGWGDQRLGEEGLGWDNKRTGEGLPAKLVERYVQRHRDVLNCHLVGVDKDQLTEGELRKLICAMESGAKVVNLPTADGGTKLYVSMLSLGPNGVRSSITAVTRVRSDENTAEASLEGVDREVNISFGRLSLPNADTFQNNISRCQELSLFLSQSPSSSGSTGRPRT